MSKIESFEVTEYGEDHNIPGRDRGVIKEIVRDMERKSPAMGIQVSFTGNLMKLTHHCYEMHLPVRMKEVEANAKQCLDEAVKYIKKEFKERLKETLNIKEKKEMANTSVQKVSLNERYMYASWRFYEIGE